jgi:hypothetical protein
VVKLLLWRTRKIPRRPWCPEIFKRPLMCAVVRERVGCSH